jgi:hypothetical protein
MHEAWSVHADKYGGGTDIEPSRDLHPEAVTAARERLPLLGRKTEFSGLETEFRRVLLGEFRCVLIEGEAGFGKSRGANEFQNVINLLAMRDQGRAFRTPFRVQAAQILRNRQRRAVMHSPDLDSAPYSAPSARPEKQLHVVAAVSRRPDWPNTQVRIDRAATDRGS